MEQNLENGDTPRKTEKSWLFTKDTVLVVPIHDWYKEKNAMNE